MELHMSRFWQEIRKYQTTAELQMREYTCVSEHYAKLFRAMARDAGTMSGPLFKQ